MLSVDFDASGRFLCACDSNHTVCVWDVEARTQISKATIAGATVCGFGADKNEVIVMDSDHSLTRHASKGLAKSGAILPGKLRFFKGSFAVTPDGAYLATTGLEQRNGLAVVRLDDTETVLLKDMFSPFVIGCHAAFPTSGDILAVATISNDAGISELHLCVRITRRCSFARGARKQTMPGSMRFADSCPH